MLTVNTEFVYWALYKNIYVLSVVPDISTAFGRVWHIGLLHKMKVYGVSGSVFELMQSFLTDRVIMLDLNGIATRLFHINAGNTDTQSLDRRCFLFSSRNLKISSSLNSIYAGDTNDYTCFNC